ncbi:MAG: EFR1 family ferrodoxin [Marinifilaceae bacterium]
MNYTTANLIYFSATGTTEKIINQVVKDVAFQRVNRYPLQVEDKIKHFNNQEIAVFALPVYSGRIPEFATTLLAKYKGNNTPAIIVTVYGNRDFDDALIELRDIVTQNGFKVISAAAFIAQHSIFPKVATNRPNAQDLALISTFGKNSVESIEAVINSTDVLQVKGNNTPYRDIKAVPLKPQVSGKCNKCGKCSKQCPVEAINLELTNKCDAEKCISCGRCIHVCPQNARKFGGLLYFVASKMFTRKYSEYQQPYIATL